MTTLKRKLGQILEVTIVDKAFLIYLLLTVLLIAETPGTSLFFLHLFATLAFIGFAGLMVIRDWKQMSKFNITKALLFILLAMESLFLKM